MDKSSEGRREPKQKQSLADYEYPMEEYPMKRKHRMKLDVTIRDSESDNSISIRDATFTEASRWFYDAVHQLINWKLEGLTKHGQIEIPREEKETTPIELNNLSQDDRSRKLTLR